MAIAFAGKNPYLAQQYWVILSEGCRMMRMHFDYLTEATDETLLTDEHTGILDAIIAQDAEKADSLAHAHTRQFRDRFMRYLQENRMSDKELSL